ncbi:transcriptional regulator [Bremerella cremea]|uniref:Transcriptional regulator n=1 Tax=Bremerella cremea TaxID=1031537 RepID=A0A368KX20_9BACT|nr:transcriptional regulator [Bremerella cremea]
MLYDRSREIESRLDDILHLIRAGGYSTPKLAEALEVSVPTVSRSVKVLKNRGYAIKAQRRGTEWHYVLANEAENVDISHE